MNHQINIDEAIAIAKEYHLETEVTECIKQGMSPIEALIEGEIGDTQHRIILRYDNEFIPVVKNIITDFNLTNNIKS